MAESVADEAEVVSDDELFDELFHDQPLGAPSRAELVREGEVLAGKYRVERIPGRNGLGVLVQVRHVELGQEVILKFLVPDACVHPEFVQRFIREARAAVKIQGEHVARVTDVGRLESGAPYMVREFLRGPDLSEVVKVRGALPISEACDYIVQAAEAVAEAHALGIAHRNLRPTTLVVTRRTDGAPLIKVFDFGATEALHIEPFSKRSAALVGSSALLASLPYLSPEQVRDPHGVDFRADIYGLGAVLYELLSGQPPFEAESAPALLAMVAADLPVPVGTLRPDLPEALEQIVMCCLAKSRDLRFSNIAELAMALRQYASIESTSSIDRIVRLARRSSRPPSLSAARISTPLPSFESASASAPRAARSSMHTTPSSRTSRRLSAPGPAPTIGMQEERPSSQEAALSAFVESSPTLFAMQARAEAAYRGASSPSTSVREPAQPPPSRVPPPLQTRRSTPPPPVASPTSKATIRPPVNPSTMSGGLSRSWAAPAPDGGAQPLKKLALIGLVAACGGFGVIIALHSTGIAGLGAAAGQPIVAAQLPTQVAPAPVATTAPLPQAESAALVAPPPTPLAVAVAAAPVAATAAAPLAPAPPAPRPVAPPPPPPRAPAAAQASPTPHVARPRPIAPAPVAEEATRASAKVAAAQAKELFSDPN